MAKIAQETPIEKIEIVDLPEESAERSGPKLKLIIPAVIVAALAAFLVVRRVLGGKDA